MKDIKSIDLKNKKVILRLDLNVTIKNGVIVDDTKIRKSIPTIKYILDNGSRVLMMSHLGKVKTEEDKDNKSLKLVAERLEELLGQKVNFIPVTQGSELEESINKNQLTLMENTRFEDVPEKKESGCDDELSSYWASLGDVFINDAFGTSHRKHASNSGIAKYCDSAYGLLIEEEIKGLSPIIEDVKSPFVVIMGGAKVDDKIKLIEALLDECDYLLVGGGIANTFLKANGIEIGSSIHSAEYVGQIKELYERYKEKILLPDDVVVKKEFENKTTPVSLIEEKDTIYDIGLETIKRYSEILKEAKTIFVNGTMGLYEEEAYKNGTEELYKCLNECDAIKIAGGGDAVASINNLGYENSFDYLSTGGGATLEYIATKRLKCFEGKR